MGGLQFSKKSVMTKGDKTSVTKASEFAILHDNLLPILESLLVASEGWT
jgi:hypothetical protein